MVTERASAPGSFVTHLECAHCGRTAAVDALPHMCPTCDGPLLVRYDLGRISAAVTKTDLKDRPWSMWRYRELLPCSGAAVSLGESTTPLLEAETLGRSIGLTNLRIKDEGLLPTGTFKSRGAAIGVTKALEFGAEVIALPTAGNAGSAWAAYGARAGIKTVVAMPSSTPLVIQREAAQYGARVYLVHGTIADAGTLIKEACERYGWYHAATLREPYRVEGKKTIGFELAEQLGWNTPDVVVFPTGGGVGVIGMEKAFAELRALGWIGAKAVRFVAVQAEGCAPIVRAFRNGSDESKKWANSATIAAGLNVPKALGDIQVLRILRKSGGVAVAVSDEQIVATMQRAAESSGLLVCPEGAAAIAGAADLRAREAITQDEMVVVVNTGNGLKYPDSLRGGRTVTLSPGERIPDE